MGTGDRGTDLDGDHLVLLVVGDMNGPPKPVEIMLTLVVIAVLIYLGWLTIGEWK